MYPTSQSLPGEAGYNDIMFDSRPLDRHHPDAERGDAHGGAGARRQGRLAQHAHAPPHEQLQSTPLRVLVNEQLDVLEAILGDIRRVFGREAGAPSSPTGGASFAFVADRQQDKYAHLLTTARLVLDELEDTVLFAALQDQDDPAAGYQSAEDEEEAQSDRVDRPVVPMMQQAQVVSPFARSLQSPLKNTGRRVGQHNQHGRWGWLGTEEVEQQLDKLARDSLRTRRRRVARRQERTAMSVVDELAFLGVNRERAGLAPVNFWEQNTSRTLRPNQLDEEDLLFGPDSGSRPKFTVMTQFANACYDYFASATSLGSNHPLAGAVELFVRAMRVCKLPIPPSEDALNEHVSMVNTFIRHHADLLFDSGPVKRMIQEHQQHGHGHGHGHKHGHDHDHDSDVQSFRDAARYVARVAVEMAVAVPLHPTIISWYHAFKSDEDTLLFAFCNAMAECEPRDVGVPPFFQLSPDSHPTYSSVRRGSTSRSHSSTSLADADVDVRVDADANQDDHGGDGGGGPYERVIEVLKRLGTCDTWRRKAELLMYACRLVTRCANEHYDGVVDQLLITCDELILVLSYCLLKTSLPNLASESLYLLDALPEGEMLGEAGYCATTFQSAVMHLLDLASSCEIIEDREDDGDAVNDRDHDHLDDKAVGAPAPVRRGLLSQLLERQKRESDDDRSSSSRHSFGDLTTLRASGASLDRPTSVFDRVVADGVRRLFELENDSGWVYDSTMNGVSISRRSMGDDTNIYGMKGEGAIAARVDDIIRLLSEPGNRMHFDSLCIGSTLVQRIDDHSNIVHMAFKVDRLCMTQYRDFCVIVHWDILEDGTGIVFGRSVKHRLCPPDPKIKFTRGQVLFSGWIVRPRSGSDAHVADVVYMVHIDPGGYVPAWLVNIVAKKQPMLVHDLREFFSVTDEDVEDLQ